MKNFISKTLIILALCLLYSIDAAAMVEVENQPEQIRQIVSREP